MTVGMPQLKIAQLKQMPSKKVSFKMFLIMLRPFCFEFETCQYKIEQGFGLMQNAKALEQKLKCSFGKDKDDVKMPFWSDLVVDPPSVQTLL